jgi:hypothetical protein
MRRTDASLRLAHRYLKETASKYPMPCEDFVADRAAILD